MYREFVLFIGYKSSKDANLEDHFYHPTIRGVFGTFKCDAYENWRIAFFSLSPKDHDVDSSYTTIIHMFNPPYEIKQVFYVSKVIMQFHYGLLLAILF